MEAHSGWMVVLEVWSHSPTQLLVATSLACKKNPLNGAKPWIATEKQTTIQYNRRRNTSNANIFNMTTTTGYFRARSVMGVRSHHLIRQRLWRLWLSLSMVRLVGSGFHASVHRCTIRETQRWCCYIYYEAYAQQQLHNHALYVFSVCNKSCYIIAGRLTFHSDDLLLRRDEICTVSGYSFASPLLYYITI